VRFTNSFHYLLTSSAPVNDLIVAFYARSMFWKSYHQAAQRNSRMNFFIDAKIKLGAFLPQAQPEG